MDRGTARHVLRAWPGRAKESTRPARTRVMQVHFLFGVNSKVMPKPRVEPAQGLPTPNPAWLTAA